MIQYGLRLAVFMVPFIFIVLVVPVFSVDYHYHPARKSFFTVNPSLRADALAQQAAELDDVLRQNVSEPISPLTIALEERKTQEGGNWNELDVLGFRMSLSRLDLEQDDKRRERQTGDDLFLPDFRSIFSRGSFGKDDLEALGEFFRPQLKLGIEF